MPTLSQPPTVVLSDSPPPWRWTREACLRLKELELLPERFELIEGIIYTKMPKNRRHVLGLRRVRNWLFTVFGEEVVQEQDPIEIASEDQSYNDPEPDIAVLRQSVESYQTQAPGAVDILLLIEISDATLSQYRNQKARLYARAGIEDYWALDVRGRRLFVHRDPSEEGYRSVLEYTEDETIAPLAAPEAHRTIRALLPNPEES
ncbi:Uma2 family endonuclease [Armatimonas rosea]|uniref:Uma2 family endonuclease n=1 Tax=Armatimonas rosea TaxID=685828 RepID=A0A7W9SS40_ARMRO|nr:Uma2 family endonuclease [Armatimonas rosea]MBB6051821.1 Uma2 family endonuclease [Armatimonas rosea]